MANGWVNKALRCKLLEYSVMIYVPNYDTRSCVIVEWSIENNRYMVGLELYGEEHLKNLNWGKTSQNLLC